jgi:P27 family predicted phage terminase small subunit
MAALTPPRDLSTASKKQWRSTIRALESAGAWVPDQDLDLLERYIRACETVRDARAAVAEQGVTVEGSKNQIRPHPLLKTIAEFERDAQRYAEALLLTPKARAGAGDGNGGGGGEDDPLEQLVKQFHGAPSGG